MSHHRWILTALLSVFCLLVAACGQEPQETAGEAGVARDTATPGDTAPADTAAPDDGQTETGTEDAAPEATAGAEEDAEMVMIGYGGDLAIPYRDFLVAPFLEDHPGVTVDIIPSESGDFVAQIRAAQGTSPYDVVPLGESRLVTAIEDGWVAELGADALPNLEEVDPVFQDACRSYGSPVTYSLIGLAYNPDRVPAPESWEDLWSNPEYEGEIGLVSSASNLGFAFIVLAAQLAGGSESELEPGLDRIAELEPFIVAPNPTALAQLFERGEIGIAPLWNNDAAVLKDKGLAVEFVRPEPGAIADVTCMVMVENTAYPELSRELINRAIDESYQEPAAQSPFFFGPTNANVDVPEGGEAYLSQPDEFGDLIRIDWDAASPLRSEITEQFNQRFGG